MKRTAKIALIVVGGALVLAAAGVGTRGAIDGANRAEAAKVAIESNRRATEARLAEQERQYEQAAAEIRDLRKRIAATKDDD